MTSNFSVNITDSSNPSIKVIELVGELDESRLEELKNSTDTVLNDSNVSSIIFNMANLEFINSKGIGFLVSFHTHLTKDGRKMILVAAQEAVMDVISLVGLTSIIPYFENVDEALASA